MLESDAISILMAWSVRMMKMLFERATVVEVCTIQLELKSGGINLPTDEAQK